MPPSFSDTTAFRIVRQILDHVWGSDEELEDGDLVSILEGFRDAGGSWQGVTSGSMKDVEKLEAAVEAHVRARSMAIIASRIAGLG